MRQNPTLALYVTNRGALVDYASGILGNRAQAEDLVQEAWLRFEAAARQRLLEEPQGYLYRIFRNLAFDCRRRMLREAEVVATVPADHRIDAAPDGLPTPEAIALHRDDFARVMAALGELPERTRIALEMHRFGGCKLREIAAYFGISVPLAHLLVAEGVQHCKHRLGWP